VKKMPVLNLNTVLMKRKRVSKPDREAIAHKKRKDRFKKRRYDTDYSSSSENESDVISLHSRNADEERSVISETVSRKTFFGNTPSQASTSNFTRFNPHKKEKVGPILSDDMKDYIDDNFNLFLPNQKIQDLILKTYPIPEHNALSIKKIDPLVISILEGQRRSINKNVDRAFTAIQNRLFMTMGPLVHLWLTLDKINNSFETTPNLDDSAHAQLDNIDIRQLIDLVEKTICCLGQTNVLF